MYTYHMLGWKSIPPTFSLFYLASFPLMSLSFSLSLLLLLFKRTIKEGSENQLALPPSLFFPSSLPLTITHSPLSILPLPFESQNFSSPSLESSIFQFNIVVYHMTVMWSIFLYTLYLHRYILCRISRISSLSTIQFQW